MRQMHAAMSPDNVYWRFFNMSPGAAEQEAGRVCREPGEGHAALLAWLGGQLVGVASYEPAVAPAVADVAVAVADHMHGRGVATLLLEHLVSIGRHRKLQAFTAKTLAANAAVRRVAGGMGLPAKQEIADGIIDLTFPLPYDDAESHLDSYLDAMAGRERLANVASLRHLLQPTSVAVVGASRRPGTVGRAILAQHRHRRLRRARVRRQPARQRDRRRAMCAVRGQPAGAGGCCSDGGPCGSCAGGG